MSLFSNLPDDFSVLKGRTLTKIENKGTEILFYVDDGKTYRQIYYEDCCATCSVEEIHGDLDDLVGTPILNAEQVHQEGPEDEHGYNDSQTWTFYKASTIKGSVTIRWYGSSNGYYSETPTFEEMV